MNHKRPILLTVAIGALGMIMLSSFVLLAADTRLNQIDPTAQQETIDAIVQQRLQQTAQAQQQIDLTRTVDAAFSRALTATAAFEVTINAQISRAQVATRQAGTTFANANADWTPFSDDFDGVPMMLVPAGCFTMGSEDGESRERPASEQCFDAPFWIDQTEVTQADFVRLGGVKANANYFTGDQRPVEQITWFEARDFCAWRGGRLPTESEWEYAARGPNNLEYPWGDAWDETKAVWSGNTNSQTADVGSIAAGASWVGALDLSGNVWEWVSTIYGIDNGNGNFPNSGELTYAYPYVDDDGREQNVDNRTYVRVLRGGSWNYYNPTLLRAASRGWNTPGYYDYSIGVRCARS